MAHNQHDPGFHSHGSSCLSTAQRKSNIQYVEHQNKRLEQKLLNWQQQESQIRELTLRLKQSQTTVESQERRIQFVRHFFVGSHHSGHFFTKGELDRNFDYFLIFWPKIILKMAKNDPILAKILERICRNG